MMIKSILNYNSCFLLLLIISCTVISAESFLLSKNVPSLDRITLVHRISTSGGDMIRLNLADKSPDEERSQANEIMAYCAKITALSAAVDFVVEGPKLVAGIAAGKWLLPLTTLWKVSFSYNTWRVSKMYNEKTETLSELYQLLERLMISMTGIWRRLAFMVSLLTLDDVVSLWHDSIPNIRLALNVLYGVVGVISIELSTRETQNIIAERPPSEDSGSNETPTQRISRFVRVAVRAMSLGVSAFVLKAVFTPAIALKKTRSNAILDLVDLTVTIPFATMLWKLRKSYITFIGDVARLESSKESGIKPETQIQLAIAQQNFWGKIKSFQQTQMVLKALTVIAQLKF
uniref:Uncharacterized protein n=1 Tax=Pseudo-nitzschia australis TaxID=44445 RepID=A0A7S4AEF9_9STRA